MMKSLSIFSAILTLAGAAAVAMPPRQGLLEIPQPDGTSVKAELFGDGNWYTYISPDGTILTADASGRLVRSEQTITDRGKYLRTKARESRVQSRNTVSSYPTKGKIKTLVILAQFSDMQFISENPADAVTRMLTMPGFSDNGATGSVRDYFNDSSFGAFELDPVILGPVTLPEKMAYYGGPDEGKPDIRPAEMIRDACVLVDDKVDFSEFDLDGDGYIDNVYVFYPGYSQADGASANTIWPHSGYAYAKLRAEFDGVALDKYACSNEIDMSTGSLVGIGTFCHEFSHVLGLPDLYATDYSNDEHPATWSIMASGGRNNNGHTPPLYSAYERYALGWLDPKPLEASEHDLSLEAGENTAFILSTTADNEFYIIENRQRRGWDAHLPGHGMLVWHIDYDRKAWQSNSVNNVASHQRIDLIEADGISSDENRSGDSYPGSADVCEIPAFRPYSGTTLDKGIFNIRELPGGNILFNVANLETKLDVPASITAENISPVSFDIEWDGVEGATAYIVEVYQKIRTGSVFKKEYVDGYRLFMTGTECTAAVTGLTPSTEYYFRVRAMGGCHISDYSAEQSLTTLEEDFRSDIPVCSDATELSSEGFTANWEALPGAVSYNLTVKEVTPLTTYYHINDFADGNMTPDEWIVTSGCTTSSFSGYYGNTAPGLSMTSDNAYVQSPLETAMITSVEFWYRGVKTEDRHKIMVYAFDGRKWQTIAEIGSLVSDKAGARVELVDEFANVPYYSVHIAFSRPLSKGTLVIDDIRVTHQATSAQAVERYNPFETENVLSADVTGLKPATLYSYTVSANDGSLTSLDSTPRLVRTLDASGAESAIADNNAIELSASASAIVARNNTGVETTLRIYTLTGTCIHTSVLPAGGYTSVPVEAGLYIAVADGIVRKLTAGCR